MKIFSYIDFYIPSSTPCVDREQGRIWIVHNNNNILFTEKYSNYNFF